jgi:hypothetical protein
MSGLFSPEVLVALGVSASAGLATVLGSLFVLRLDKTNSHHLAIALAFAGGAMVYVSLVEILPKSAAAFGEVHGAKAGYAWITLAFFGGIGLLVLLDRLVPNPHPDIAATSRRDKAAVARMSLLTAAAITAHNLPEGLPRSLQHWTILRWEPPLPSPLRFTTSQRASESPFRCITQREAARRLSWHRWSPASPNRSVQLSAT